MTTTQHQALIDTRALFTALPADQKDIAAKVGDRIVMIAADGAEDVMEVLIVKPKGVIAQSLIDSNAKLRLMLTYDGGENLMTDDSKQVLFQMSEEARAAAAASTTPVIRKGRAPARAPGGITKIAFCKGLWNDPKHAEHVKTLLSDDESEAGVTAKSAAKSAICKSFQHEGGCTRMGANTYYLTIIKAAKAGTLDEIGKGRQEAAAEEVAPEAGTGTETAAEAGAATEQVADATA